MQKVSKSKPKKTIEGGESQINDLRDQLVKIEKNIEEIETKITQQQKIKQNIKEYNEKNEEIIKLESKMSFLNLSGSRIMLRLSG